MFKKIRSDIIKAIYIAIDLFFIVLSIYLACKIRHVTVPFKITSLNIFFGGENPFKLIFVFWTVTIIVFLYSNSLYRTKREILEGIEINLVVKSIVLSSAVVVLIIYLFKIQGFPRSIFFISTIFITVFLVAWRIIKRLFVEFLVAHGYNNFNVLIAGAGKVGIALREEIRRRPGLGLNVVGFLDDYKISSKPDDIKVVGKMADFEKVAQKEFISEIFITCHHDGNVVLKLIETAKMMNIAVKVVPQGFELMSGDFSKYNIGFVPIIEYSNVRKFGIQFGKRIFDIAFSLLACIVLMPVFVAIIIAIKRDSKGSVFYNAYRYGMGGKKFRMFKFRSMKVDADKEIERYKDKNESDGPIFKMKNDPRITAVGRILRKYSLDELPQIFNVLLGDMSLVGPRPFPLDQVEKEDFNQLKRLEVRPGITGLWQIRGRSDVSFKRLVKWDIWYINNWSFWLDLNILFQTIPVVLKGKGAY